MPAQRSAAWSLSVILWTLLATVPPSPGQAAEPAATATGDALVADYFCAETAALTDATMADIDTLQDWTSRRDQYRQQLFEMLGLDPLLQRTPLHSEVTGTLENEGVIVEKVHFQSLPGLYVTGNLYRPADQDGPLPAILYVCGHGRVQKDGVSLGNKTHYQHHGGWFARNGYVCLTIDTIQLGEIEGIHHGTHREKMWWWNNRGYTPAGVEAWNCIRALDYLQSRDEVDDDRIGVTGRSGGGAYSWWIAALDERIKVAVPVAGITSLHNHVVDGCVEGHCDCMFMVNTYRWDYPMVAALVAPRPLLISNTDKDGIFPLEGVIDVHAKVRKIYQLYGAADQLGLQITEGPHKDTQELRIHAFRWFNRFLRDDDALIETAARPLFEQPQLKVFDSLPSDQRVTTIHESFVPAASPDELPASAAELQSASQRWMETLQQKTFRGWPQQSAESLDVRVVAESELDGMHVSAVEYTSQSPYRLQLFVVRPQSARDAGADQAPRVVVLDQAEWELRAGGVAHALPDQLNVDADEAQWQSLRSGITGPTAFVIPRGVGPTEWSRDDRTRTHIRRRFMLLGQTAATMQIYDVHRALQAVDQLPGWQDQPLTIRGSGDAAVWALYASLFSDQVKQLQLHELPLQNRDAPDLLNVSRFVEMPQLVLMAASKVQSLLLSDGADTASRWAQQLSKAAYVPRSIELVE